MGLAKCPDCGKDVSDQASSCPNCGHPVKAVVIEQTAKKYKAMQLLGIFLIIIGIFSLFGSLGSTSSESSGMFGFSGGSALLIFVGLICYIAARMQAWWHHK